MTQQALLALLARTLPMLEQLGDYIGNGEIDPDRPHSLGKRCDLILDINQALAVLAPLLLKTSTPGIMVNRSPAKARWGFTPSPDCGNCEATGYFAYDDSPTDSSRDEACSFCLLDAIRTGEMSGELNGVVYHAGKAAPPPTYGYIDVLVVSKGGEADHVRVGYARGLGVFGVRGEARPTPVVLRAARGRIIADGTLTADELGPQQSEWPLA